MISSPCISDGTSWAKAEGVLLQDDGQQVKRARYRGYERVIRPIYETGQNVTCTFVQVTLFGSNREGVNGTSKRTFLSLVRHGGDILYKRNMETSPSVSYLTHTWSACNLDSNSNRLMVFLVFDLRPKNSMSNLLHIETTGTSKWLYSIYIFTSLNWKVGLVFSSETSSDIDGIEFLAHGIVMDFNSGKVWNFGKQGNLSFEKNQIEGQSIGTWDRYILTTVLLEDLCWRFSWNVSGVVRWTGKGYSTRTRNEKYNNSPKRHDKAKKETPYHHSQGCFFLEGVENQRVHPTRLVVLLSRTSCLFIMRYSFLFLSWMCSL